MLKRSSNNCLLIAATANEINPFIKKYKGKPGDFGDLDILVTGVGSVATTWALTKQIGIKRPGLIIQAGIAGSFPVSVPLGTVFVVDRDTIADLGVQEGKKYKSVFDMKLADPNQPPFKKGWLINDNPLIKKTGLEKVRAVTINGISTDKKVINLYRKKFDPVIESMEGAALHYVCLLEKIPFLQLRAVSNYVGERNKKNWLMKESLYNLNNQLTRLLLSL